MSYQVGDKVIHWNYGLGEIIKLDEKIINGKRVRCYVVQIRDLTIWVQANEIGTANLRLPTRESEYQKLFAILQSPGEPLPDDRLERKNHLLKKMKDGELSSICQVIRDLYFYRRIKKLNDYDTLILERAKSFLTAEWMYSLSVPLSEAQQELDKLLEV